MLHDCAKNASDVFAAADALEAFLAAGVAHCFAVYVEKRTVYGPFILHGSLGARGSTYRCLIQSGLRAGSIQGFPDDVPGRLVDDGSDDEHGAIVFAQEFDVDFWHVVLPLL